MQSANIIRRCQRRLCLYLGMVALVLSCSMGTAAAETAESKEEIALSLARLLLAARSVVSDQQDLINDHTKGYKGFTAQFVTQAAKKAYENETGDSVDEVDAASLQGRLLRAELEAIAEVIDGMQERINRKNVAFKGFLPTIFAVEVAAKFRAKVGELAEIKVTAPPRLIRNRANSPDGWETKIIVKNFQSADHTMGEHIYGPGYNIGRAGFRLILPEYYTQSCLRCHGGPKGRRDITGGIKEGAKLGDLGGAISVTLFDAS